MERLAKIGIIGGSGFCNFPELENDVKINIQTKYGNPSDKITLGGYAGDIIAFLPRHGYEHQLPPHAIPYRANIAALKQLGINTVFAFCAAGSLKKKIKPGDFVLFDQFINFTWGRDTTFEPNQPFIHLPMAEPYSRSLREVVYSEGKKLGIKVHGEGTVVVIQGPRFNTKAESKWFSKMGWDVVNMTQYPECYFAKEQGFHYTGIGAITDYDAYLQDLGLSMTKEKITENAQIFKYNVQRMKKLITAIILNWGSYKNTLGEVYESTKYYYEL